MVKSDKISHFLPIQFRNGDRVQQFAKKCPHCGKTVSAAQMHGIAANINERILLAARAECAQCRFRFPVTCVITPQKRVLRVVVPLWLYRLYIQLLMPDSRPAPRLDTPATADTAPQRQPLPVAAHLVDASAEIIGYFGGRPIASSVMFDGQICTFERTSADQCKETLAADEILLEGGLIYRRQR